MGDGCGMRDAGCGVWGAAFEVGIGMIYEWACLSVTADCVEAMIVLVEFLCVGFSLRGTRVINSRERGELHLIEIWYA